MILSPVEGLCDTFRALLPESPPADFKTVLDLKGLKKSEQAALSEEWGRRSFGSGSGAQVPSSPSAWKGGPNRPSAASPSKVKNFFKNTT